MRAARRRSPEAAGQLADDAARTADAVHIGRTTESLSTDRRSDRNLMGLQALRHSRLAVTLIGAAGAAIIVAGTTAIAAVPSGPGGAIYSCYNTKTGAL